MVVICLDLIVSSATLAEILKLLRFAVFEGSPGALMIGNATFRGGISSRGWFKAATASAPLAASLKEFTKISPPLSRQMLLFCH
jgi:hypothetical protein